MLSGAKLPHKFWAEALSTAVYLRNRSPTKAVDNSTPFKAWTGIKPNMKHLIGTAYAHIQKDDRLIFMGYGTETKGYCWYDSKCGKIFEDVQFHELECGVEESNEQDEKKYIELEFPSDDDMLPDTPVEPVPRRSEQERRPPIYFGERANITSSY